MCYVFGGIVCILYDVCYLCGMVVVLFGVLCQIVGVVYGIGIVWQLLVFDMLVVVGDLQWFGCIGVKCLLFCCYVLVIEQFFGLVGFEMWIGGVGGVDGVEGCLQVGYGIFGVGFGYYGVVGLGVNVEGGMVGGWCCVCLEVVWLVCWCRLELW